MTERIITDSNGRKHITNEPQLHPPQRTWVGLTEEELQKILQEVSGQGWKPMLEAIEAKLKAKNSL